VHKVLQASECKAAAAKAKSRGGGRRGQQANVEEVQHIVVKGVNMSKGIRVEEDILTQAAAEKVWTWWGLHKNIHEQDQRAQGRGMHIYPQRTKMQAKLSVFDDKGGIVKGKSGLGSYYTYARKGEKKSHAVDAERLVPEEGNSFLGVLRDNFAPGCTSCIVNEYDGNKEHYIDWHIDNPAYPGGIKVITLLQLEQGAAVPTLDFRHPSIKQQVKRVALNSGSLCAFSGRARTDLQHSLVTSPGVKRLSLTFRTDVNDATLRSAGTAVLSPAPQQTCRPGTPVERHLFAQLTADIATDISMSRGAARVATATDVCADVSEVVQGASTGTVEVGVVGVAVGADVGAAVGAVGSAVGAAVGATVGETVGVASETESVSRNANLGGAASGSVALAAAAAVRLDSVQAVANSSAAGGELGSSPHSGADTGLQTSTKRTVPRPKKSRTAAQAKKAEIREREEKTMFKLAADRAKVGNQKQCCVHRGRQLPRAKVSTFDHAIHLALQQQNSIDQGTRMPGPHEGLLQREGNRYTLSERVCRGNV
jgi:alkylated DNA repair dioxygenase AlkB